ncbi:MAG: cobyric acid synthase [Thermodesulfovibrionales bacterium]|nr:cobyric acid synthase [Thermodesulfovibrionales bacterium]
MSRTLMIQGTGSGVGKSLFVAALCRYFNNKGINVSPFKAQNMALNSYITIDGGEIGRAQALQAEAARVPPIIDMNPILLKASGEMGAQVIIHGKPIGHMKPRQYYANKKMAWEAVKSSFKRLSRKYDLIIIEGAGSPAEINLMDADIVNMAVARYCKAPVILLGDIDKGGVFASFYGTIKLLGRLSNYIKAFVINKFRGDPEILNPGLKLIEEKTKKPVIGVVPYLHHIGLPEEDSLSLSRNYFSIKPVNTGKSYEKIKIVVVRLKYMSNFTDFDPLFYEPDVDINYSQNPTDIENADMVIIPGTKSTIRDLLFLRELKLDESIKRAFNNGVYIMGMCGGYQILGRKIFDPFSVESKTKEVEGLGILDIETTFQKTKVTSQVKAEFNGRKGGEIFPFLPLLGQDSQSQELRGYEIHMGESTGDVGLFKVKRISECQLSGSKKFYLDGSQNSNCWGTYIHGIFDNDYFRRGVLNYIREIKGLSPLPINFSYSQLKDDAIENLSENISENIDMDFIERLLNL